MIDTIDDGAAVAAFRHGRSLCLRLHGTLDTGLARAAAAILRQDRTAVRLRLECSTLRCMEAPAANRLGDAILAWVAAADGRTVDLHNLDLGLQGQDAGRALRAFQDPDETVFFDPAREPHWSAAPSRH